MRCPTCSHAMEAVQTEPTRIFHCHRCGTLKQEFPTGACAARWWAPRLVERCREFEATILSSTIRRVDWHRLGIAEAICLPEDRK